jgi:hypothetical protein
MGMERLSSGATAEDTGHGRRQRDFRGQALIILYVKK